MTLFKVYKIPRLTITVALILFSFIIFFSFRQNKAVTDSTSLITQSQQVLFVSQKLSTEAIEVETNSRAYALTGVPFFLESYKTAKVQLPATISFLKKITADDPSQKIIVDKLARVIIKRGIFSDSLVRLNIKDRQEGVSVVIKNNTNEYLQLVKTGVYAMQQEENILLHQRIIKRKIAEDFSFFVSLIVVLCMLVLLIIVFLKENKLRAATEIARSKEELRKSELSFQLLVNSINEYAIFFLDITGHVATWNSGAQKIKGYKEDEIIGKHISIFFTPDEIALGGPQKNLDRALATGHFETEAIRVRKDGTTFFANVVYTSLFDSEGKLYGFAKITKDITAKKEAEEKLKFLAKIADNIQDPIISSDANRYITKWNHAAEKLLGWREEEVLGQAINEVCRIVYPNETREEIWRQFNENKYWHGEVIYHTKDGVPLNVLATGSAFLDEDGNITGNLVLVKDITARKKAEEALNKLNEELEQRVRDRTQQVIKLNAGLEQKVLERTEELLHLNKEMEAFSYSVSHDLRAPLRGIIGFATILEEDYSNTMDKEALRITSVIKANTLRMGELIDDLLSFSRLGRQPLCKMNVNMHDLLKEIVCNINVGKNAKNIEWKIAPLPVVKADYTTIRQVWINLVLNAVKYSAKSEHPTIQIGTEVHADELIFFVKDNGVGFDEKYKDKLFKVFQRLHSTKEYEGTGVGLAIVEKIVKKHGGRVWAQASKGNGATFYFTLSSN